MAEVFMQFPEPLQAGETLYSARACGRPAPDGGWEGWIEFVPDDGSPVLRSQRETRQPDRDALLYWTTGLTPVYLEGSLERTLDPVRPKPVMHVEPAYNGPAPDPFAAPVPAAPTAVLDPFSVYAKGEDLLRQELNALSRWHLRNISRAHGLFDADTPEMLRLTRAELAEAIVQAVRMRVDTDVVARR
jgi:hypothetical protein